MIIILNHKKAVVITNDQHLRDRHLLPDLIPGPPDLPAGQVVGPEVLQEALFQDHPDHPELDNDLNSNTILLKKYTFLRYSYALFLRMRNL